MKKLTGAFLLFYCAMTFCSCVAMMKSSIKDDGKQIPPNIGKNETTMLVLRNHRRSYDKRLERNFEKYYFGKYIVIDERDLRLGEYDDKEKYRFIFKDDTRTSYVGTGKPTDYGQKTIVKYQVTDRVTGSVYKTKHGTAAFSAWMKAYIKKLEKARQP